MQEILRRGRKRSAWRARSLSRALSRPHVAELLRTKVLGSLAIAAARAGAVKVDLLDSDNAIARDAHRPLCSGSPTRPASAPALSLKF